MAGIGLVLLGLCLYVSSLAYTLRSYSRSRVSEQLGDDGERWLEWLDNHENQLQVTTSFFRLLANLAIVLVFIFEAWALYDGGLFALTATKEVEFLSGVLLPAALALLTLVIVNIGLAHAIAVHAGEELLAYSLWPLTAMRVAAWPVVKLIGGVEFVVRRLAGKPETTAEAEHERSEEEILEHVSEARALGAVNAAQELMIEAVLELHDTPVSAIMTPRTDIVAVNANCDFETVRAAVVEAGHSRVPVIEDGLDQITGMLYVKDLMTLSRVDQFDLRSLMRPVQYVPETKTADQLLREFQTKKVHIAVVLDEYGGTSGIVTIEDILEELVGEIDDEYDEETPEPINRIDAQTLEVDARVHVSEINDELEALDVELPEDGDYETIGGFIFAALGKVPQVGEEVIHEGVHIKVLSAEERRINRVRIEVLQPEKRSA